MRTGAEAFFDCPDGPFNLANVTVGGNDVDDNGEERCANAFEFVVAVDTGDGKTTAGVKFDDVGEGGQDGVAVTVGHWGCGAKTEVA
jgi:hypothetical protein